MFPEMLGELVLVSTEVVWVLLVVAPLNLVVVVIKGLFLNMLIVTSKHCVAQI